MDFNCQLLVFRMVLFMALVGLAVSSFISEDVLKKHRSGRTLEESDSGELSCPVDFKNQNYTVLTSKCVAPEYDPVVCCAAFKEFSCPFVDQINDLENNDCATMMFGYIRLYGNYPVGMFYENCKEGKEGLDCSTNMTTSSN